MAAAAGTPLRDLCDEVTCPICLECFKDPVTITTCGHNFCRTCLSSCCQGPGKGGASCPHCRETFDHGKNIIPNRPLANVVQIAEKFRRAEKNPSKANSGEKHHQSVQISCEHETVLSCDICGTTKPYKSNTGTPLQKTRDAHKEYVDSFVEMVKEVKQNILAHQSNREKESKDLLRQMKAERGKATSLFRDLHHFLEEQEKQFLAEMEEVEKEITGKRDFFMALTFQELSRYETIIQTMKNSQQPNNELFTVRAEFFDTLLSGLQLQKANITLGSDTAHPQLTLFPDGKTAELGDRHQQLPNNPERFDVLAVVLGREEFKEGRHFWEVNVASQKEWAVGISRKNVKRKGAFSLNREEGVSMLGIWGGNYKFSLPPNPLPHFPDKKLKRIRVCLNCAAGMVSFFDAETGTLLYSTTSFPGEIVLPFFWLGSHAQLSLCQ
ncbi:hypothetical protein Chor_011610 [Crotalus horridus]